MFLLVANLVVASLLAAMLARAILHFLPGSTPVVVGHTLATLHVLSTLAFLSAVALLRPEWIWEWSLSLNGLFVDGQPSSADTVFLDLARYTIWAVAALEWVGSLVGFVRAYRQVREERAMTFADAWTPRIEAESQ